MMIPMKKCPKCNKDFVPAPLHRYKIGERVYCTYSCYIAEKKEIERREEEIRASRDPNYEFGKYNRDYVRPYHKRGQGVDIYDLEGNFIQKCETLKEAATLIGCSIALVHKCCAGQSTDAKGYVVKYREVKK